MKERLALVVLLLLERSVFHAPPSRQSCRNNYSGDLPGTSEALSAPEGAKDCFAGKVPGVYQPAPPTTPYVIFSSLVALEAVIRRK